MSAKHTPGPWHVTGTYDGGNTVAMIRSSERSVNVGAGDPEKPWDSMDSYKHTDANARLIAAAPELLEALRDALPLIDDAEGDARSRATSALSDSTGDFAERWTRVADAFARQAAAARAAISKATGEAPQSPTA